ncbi:MAG TPA: TlpA disulfide reductase family protein [Blastocatellia bacterium]|nr:TlpA disulfide reductase family protein [Blastocatellia bacterium]
MTTKHLLQILSGAMLVVACAVTFPASAQNAVASDVTLSGQVVCAACWSEAYDRKTTPYGSKADLQCAVKCSGNGVARALAVWSGDKATLYVMERGAYPTHDPSFLELVPRMVTVRGPVRTDGDTHYIKVNALKFDDAGAASQTAAPARIGDVAPELELNDLAGQPASLADHRGKVVVLNFWATWCGPCRKEMPSFANLHAKYATRGVDIIAASADSPETVNRVAPYVQAEKFPFTVLTGVTPQDLGRFGFPGVLPCTVVIDRQGKIVQTFVGMINEQQLSSLLDTLLAA